ncbi:MAG: hypothetical protein AAF352_05590 [Pseudomonadota bacterium]
MTRFHHIIVKTFLVLAWLAGPTIAQPFVPGFADLPLAPGLELPSAPTLQFDSPLGRIIETYGTGTGTPEEIMPFYQKSLQALGWKIQEPGKFLRDGELLEIDVFDADTRPIVRFRLTPVTRKP